MSEAIANACEACDLKLEESLSFVDARNILPNQSVLCGDDSAQKIAWPMDRRIRCSAEFTTA